METQKTDIEFLISAFAYSYSSMMESFYLRKRDLKVIGVHMFDESLVSECKSEYDSGVSKEEEKDIVEAIIAREKDYDTHILIPRLSPKQRIEIMREFLEMNDKFSDKLNQNLQDIIDSIERNSKSIKEIIDSIEKIQNTKNKK